MSKPTEHLNGGEVEKGESVVGSIGRALAVRPGVLNDDLRAAVTAIDRVHGVSNVPSIPLEFRSDLRPRGRILFDPESGLPARILVRLDASHHTSSEDGVHIPVVSLTDAPRHAGGIVPRPPGSRPLPGHRHVRRDEQ